MSHPVPSPVPTARPPEPPLRVADCAPSEATAETGSRLLVERGGVIVRGGLMGGAAEIGRPRAGAEVEMEMEAMVPVVLKWAFRGEL